MTLAAARARLVDIIAARSFQSGAAVTLASGRTSTFYFNLKPTMLDPEGAHLIARLVLDALADEAVDRIGGLEMGAVPMAAAVAAVSHAEGRPLPAFFVRKQTKDHGTKSLIEGLAPHESLEGQRVAILEDVTTTGHSALRATAAAQAAGAAVVRAITIVDRLEGAAEAFAAAGLPFTPLVTLQDFL